MRSEDRLGDIWQGIGAGNGGVPGGTGHWMKHADFMPMAQADAAAWDELAVAFERKSDKPRAFAGLRNGSLEFVMVHHLLSHEIGIWLAPAQRGQGLAAQWSRMALASIDWGRARLLLAQCEAQGAAERALRQAGMRVISGQGARVTLGLYRPGERSLGH